MFSRIAINVAMISALVHMTLGCAWHHGLSFPHRCEQRRVDIESGERTNLRSPNRWSPPCGACCCRHHPVAATKDSPSHVRGDCSDRGPADQECRDDRCFLIPPMASHGFGSLDLSWWIPCCDDSSVGLKRWFQAGSHQERRSSVFETLNLRAHLYLCVQLL